MSRYAFLALFILGFIYFPLQAQERLKPYEDYIRKYTPLAMTQQVVYGIPASITLAQGLLESGAGNSSLAKNSNNHFGIKCHDDWTGKTYSHFDDGEMSCFRQYSKVEESYKDHSIFLSEKERYASLFELNIKNYKAWAKGLKKAGYATDRQYDKKLIKIIEQYDLDKIDKLALNKSRAKKIIRNWEKEYPEETATAQKPSGETESGAIAQKEKSPRVVKTGKKQEPAARKEIQLAEKAKDYSYIAETSREEQIQRNERNERTDNLPHVINAVQSHTILYKGITPYIIAQYGDNFDNISDEFGLSPQRLKKWNEWPPRYKISVGDVIFLSKKAQSWDGEESVYVVREGDSMHSISQQFGLRVSAVYQLNDMEFGEGLEVGQELKLKAQE